MNLTTPLSFNKKYKDNFTNIYLYLFKIIIFLFLKSYHSKSEL